MKTVYQDRIYKDSKGRYFTGEYLKNQFNIETEAAHKQGYKDVRLYAKTWEEYQEELTGKNIRCNYSQLFNQDARLILCNNLPEVFPEMWDYIENGDYYDEENDTYTDIFQYYIIDSQTAEDLKEHTDNIVFYIEKLDLYALGVTHWGTSWDYVPEDFIY
jgi:hypothetical protein